MKHDLTNAQPKRVSQVCLSKQHSKGEVDFGFSGVMAMASRICGFKKQSMTVISATTSRFLASPRLYLRSHRTHFPVISCKIKDRKEIAATTSI